MRIDLNCDMGEGCGADAELMPLVSSANIACGYHAGDDETMRSTVRLALDHGVAIGAHPGYADRENFGRTALELSPQAVAQLIADQLTVLDRTVRAMGGRLSHVKPHGALYNQSARDARLARAIADAVAEFDPTLVLYGLAGSCSIAAGAERGLRTAAEAFADRTYAADGTLTPRSSPDALVCDAATAAEQAMAIVAGGRVRSTDGKVVDIAAETICIHGDGPHAVGFARAIRQRLEAAGVEIVPVND